MERIKAWLSDGDAALVYTTVNRKYLTGFTSSLGYLIISKDKATLFVDGRYILAARSAVKECEVELLGNIGEQLCDFVTSYGVKRVHIENTVTLRELDSFKRIFKSTEVCTEPGLSVFIEKLRQVKTEFEIECITKAQRIAEKAFEDVLNFIKPGVKEREIAALIEYKCKCYGSEMPSFDTIAVTGKKSAMPHGVPDDTVVSDGDFVTMDFGAVYNGYHSDMTRTVAVGHATDKMAEVYNTVISAMDAAGEKIADGVRCSDVDAVARSVIERAGYGRYFTHSTGHSVGLEIHESPNLSPKSDAVLKSGNVVTDEPGIYIDGEFGVRVEDMVIVTKNGAKTLTKCQKSLIIL